METVPRWGLGSRWLRWDPHLHTPGTLRNDQFGNDWDGYIKRIEDARPAPAALGITDYYTLRGYKEVVNRKRAGALSSVALLFPNIELRLTIETKDRQGINLHLLVCPDDPDHIARMEEKLFQLRFRYRDDWFTCSEDGLRRLGRIHRGEPSLPDETALQEGANQFKVEFSDVRDLVERDPWLRKNVLVAVAAGNDGLAGIAKDSSFRAQREELGRFAQLVFSGQPGDRTYWLGQHQDFAANKQTPKPCLHGSDAHALEAVLQPYASRLCWIRGDATFDGLRQVLVEPERRSHIGEAPPPGPHIGNVIRTLWLSNVPWIDNRDIQFNDGLVTIIGAKGTGKTALADLIALAANADESTPGPASFIGKAGHLLDGLVIELEWGDGSKQLTELPRDARAIAEPRVRYLSQQFVERLCAPTGLAEPLIEEIEKVVFSAIPDEDRLQCSTFSELRHAMLEGLLAERESEREGIRAQTRQIADKTKLSRSVPGLRGKVQDADRERKRLEHELATIPMKASDEKARAHQLAMASLQKLRDAIAREERRAQELRDLSAELRRQIGSAEAALSNLRTKYPSLLDASTWDSLKLEIRDEALARLARLEQEARGRITTLREHGLAGLDTNSGQPSNSLANMGLLALTAESERLSTELGLDQANAKRRADLHKRLVIAKMNEEKAQRDLAEAENAPNLMKNARSDRLNRYETVFRTLVAEERALEQLYAPLRHRAGYDTRLSKLTFVVHRVVDVELWASRGENLLDLRKPPFNHRGALAEAAHASLLPAWGSGTPEEVRLAMQVFIDKYAGAAIEALAHGSTPLEFGEWLFSTDHIRVRYSIKYEGVEIDHLSPGTRGVILLTLYLALDDWDLRPLIIDQPEENLDPRSVFEDLVPFFRDAARRRQIIMVTHNANLVVNTDSDQVIVADAHRITPAALPHVRYLAGGLEDPEIRSHVCRLLEGGKEAFRKRGQRYGISLGVDVD